MTFVHPRTGRSWANQAMAIEMDGPLTNPAPGVVQVGKFAANPDGTVPGPTPLQQGSQFWMNSNYTGPEPTLEVKKIFSSADYARDWAYNYASSAKGAGINVNSRISSMAAAAPNVTSNLSKEIWKAVPVVSPQVAAAINYTPGGPLYTANPLVPNDPIAPYAPGSPVSGGGAGSVDPYHPTWPITPPAIPTPQGGSAIGPEISSLGEAGESITTSAKSAFGNISITMVAGALLLIAFIYMLLASKRGQAA